MPKPLVDYQNLSRSPAANHLRSAMTAAGNEPRPDRHPLTIFETRQVWDWIKSYLSHLGPRHDFVPASAAANGTSVYKVPNNVRLSVAGDWGTGTDEAAFVTDQMLVWDDGRATDVTIHLGDTYFVGDAREIEENCLGGGDDVDKTIPKEEFVKWLAGSLGCLAMNGNHEMYTGGHAYFDILLPNMGIPPGDPTAGRKGQGPSFFCLENDYWRIIGIDTGYNSVGWPIIEHIPLLRPNCKLCDELLRWLRETVRPKANPKGTVLLSHHQFFSAFPDEPNYPRPASQLTEFFENETLLWLWGHEHRFSGYKLQKGAFNVHARCIGHGGMPIELAEPHPKSKFKDELLFYDKRLNPHFPKKHPKDPDVGFNGFAQLDFAGDKIDITYRSLVPNITPKHDRYESESLVLLRETFQWDGQGNVHLRAFNPAKIDGFKTP